MSHPQSIQESEDPETVNDSNMSSDQQCVLSDSDEDRELFNLPKRSKNELSCLASVCYGAEAHNTLPLDHENLCLFTCISSHLFRKKGYAFCINTCKVLNLITVALQCIHN